MPRGREIFLKIALFPEVSVVPKGLQKDSDYKIYQNTFHSNFGENFWKEAKSSKVNSRQTWTVIGELTDSGDLKRWTIAKHDHF